MPDSNRYTCNDYRLEMQLLALQRQLNNADLNEGERRRLEQEIKLLEKQIGMH